MLVVTRAADETRRAAAKLRAGLADPDAFFAARGSHLVCYRAEGRWWADVEWEPGRSLIRYGGGGHEGPDRDAAKRSAVRRWMYEQEHPNLRREPGESLP